MKKQFAMKQIFLQTIYIVIKITTNINSIKAPITTTDGESCYLYKYDKRQIDIVNELFDEDFKNFGYEKV